MECVERGRGWSRRALGNFLWGLGLCFEVGAWT